MTERYLSFDELRRWLCFGDPSEKAEMAWTAKQRRRRNHGQMALAKHDAAAADILKECRSGRLTVHGRRHGAVAFEPIPPLEFENAEIDPIDACGDAALFYRLGERKEDHNTTDAVWVQLRFDRATALAVFKDRLAPTISGRARQKRGGGRPPGKHHQYIEQYLREYEKRDSHEFWDSNLTQLATYVRQKWAHEIKAGRKLPPLPARLTVAIRTIREKILAEQKKQ
jgi:hypothetical protein